MIRFFVEQQCIELYEITSKYTTFENKYCKKDGTFKEKGDVIKMGERMNLVEAKKKCAEVNLRAVVEKNTRANCQVIKCCQIMLTYCEELRHFKPEVIWVYGETGSGKTNYIERLVEGEDVYWKDHTKWWCGYDKHETVVMDDFRSSNMRMNELLKLIDRYPHRVEVKGGFRQMLSKKMIISSVHHPKEVYNIPEEPIQQLLRRIDKILQVFKLSKMCQGKVCRGRGNTRPRPLREI